MGQSWSNVEMGRSVPKVEMGQPTKDWYGSI